MLHILHTQLSKLHVVEPEVVVLGRRLLPLLAPVLDVGLVRVLAAGRGLPRVAGRVLHDVAEHVSVEPRVRARGARAGEPQDLISSYELGRGECIVFSNIAIFIIFLGSKSYSLSRFVSPDLPWDTFCLIWFSVDPGTPEPRFLRSPAHSGRAEIGTWSKVRKSVPGQIGDQFRVGKHSKSFEDGART